MEIIKDETNLLDRLLQDRKQQREYDRIKTLQTVFIWLDQWGIFYGIEKAFVFGSLVRPGHFWETSDVDVAVEEINPENFFQALADLSRTVERDVDLIPLMQCPFANRIREGGISWTATQNLFS